MEKRFHILLLFLFSSILFFSCSRQVTTIPKGNSLVIYPSPPDTTRVQFLTSINNSVDISGGRNAFARFVLGDVKPVPIVKPYGISLNKGRMYVCDASLAGLEVIDLENKTFNYFIPKGRGVLKMPVNCTVDTAGKLYVADAARKQIVVFDKNGEYVDAFGGNNDAKPTDVAISNGKIWVTDADHNKINVFQQGTHNLLFSFPDSTDEAAHLFQPVNMCVSNDKIYVTDFGDFKIKIYDQKGAFINSFGGFGNSLGQFVRPKGIDVDKDGIIYVVDAGFDNVQMFNPEGQLLMFIGGPYKGPGDMWLPAKVMINYDDIKYFSKFVDPGFKLKYLIFVTNQYGPDKINVYGAVDIKK